jgi:hypothetical protein
MRLRRARIAIVCALLGAMSAARAQPPRIDRQALVARHKVVHRTAAPKHFLQVGNGDFAFAFDVTGLQTLDRTFERPIPLHTMSNWGWHSFPNVDEVRYEQALSEYPVGDRTVTYADRQNTPAGEYFRANPHRVNLARIGLWWSSQDEHGATAEDRQQFADIEQTLDVWSGTAKSRFTFRGESVTVWTAAHSERDAASFRIESPLIERGELGVVIRFSYPLGVWGPMADDFERPAAHVSRWTPSGPTGGVIERELDGWRYRARINVLGGMQASAAGDHAWRFTWPGEQAGELTVEFDPPDDDSAAPTAEPLNFTQTREASRNHWGAFWSQGGAIDFSGTDDPRAHELERRVVLSQYLTAIQNGSLPPQETGLLCNSWFGKPNLEMHWWHAAHFPLWGREHLLEPSVAWYERILPTAQAIARRQGYAGARWPKMTSPDGVSSPSGVGEFLIWQQPHIIYLAELMHRAQPTAETLDRYAVLTNETARFMADFVAWDDDGSCHLAPPLIPSQENYDRRTTRDPTFELVYWRWALETAQKWRERRGQPREPEWDRVIAALPKPHIRDGRYAAVATPPFTNTADHPSMLAAYGVLPKSMLVDAAVMHRTAQWVDANWQWDHTWGWDFPMIAMTYARCGDAEGAVNALLRDTPKNTYLANGHNYQEQRLPAYLPGNGGLLAAVALMAAGSDDQSGSAPVFPPQWKVRYEGLRPLP